jgi:hypothetical protein
MDNYYRYKSTLDEKNLISSIAYDIKHAFKDMILRAIKIGYIHTAHMTTHEYNSLIYYFEKCLRNEIQHIIGRSFYSPLRFSINPPNLEYIHSISIRLEIGNDPLVIDTVWEYNNIDHIQRYNRVDSSDHINASDLYSILSNPEARRTRYYTHQHVGVDGEIRYCPFEYNIDKQKKEKPKEIIPSNLFSMDE